jgi:hypothetical protein
MYLCKNLYIQNLCKLSPNIFQTFFALPILTMFQPCKMCQNFSIFVFALSPFFS